MRNDLFNFRVNSHWIIWQLAHAIVSTEKVSFNANNDSAFSFRMQRNSLRAQVASFR